MALIFPGDVPGSSPQRVVPKHVGTRTLVFSTPGWCLANLVPRTPSHTLSCSCGETVKLGLGGNSMGIGCEMKSWREAWVRGEVMLSFRDVS